MDSSSQVQNGLTDDEKICLHYLVMAWNSFIAMDINYSDDVDEFRMAIHDLQKVVALRVARRVNPDVWNSKSK
jgi:hypothetical protein